MAGKVFTIDDGTREYTIENTYGEVLCKFRFRPSDISIKDRYDTVIYDFETIAASLQDISLNNDGSAKDAQDWEVLKKVETELRQKFCTLLDSQDVDAIFEKRSPFSSVGGQFFCIKIFEIIRDIIQEAFEEEARLSAEKMGKYLEDIQEA